LQAISPHCIALAFQQNCLLEIDCTDFSKGKSVQAHSAPELDINNLLRYTSIRTVAPISLGIQPLNGKERGSMATNSLIGYQTPGGAVSFIWCKQDGGLARVGSLLASAYTDLGRLMVLMELGDLLALGPAPGTAHPQPPRGTASTATFRKWYAAYGAETTALHRDCGAALRQKRSAPDAESFRHSVEDHEHAYLLTADRGWLWSDHRGPWMGLAQALDDVGSASAASAA
jgi:hypothetical protein